MLSLGNTPSALNEKTKKTCFLIFLLSSLFSLLSSLLSRSRQKSPQRAGWPRQGSGPAWRPHLGTLGGFFWGLFSIVFSVWSLSSRPSSCFCLLLVSGVLVGFDHMSRVTAQYPCENTPPGKCKPCCSTVAVQLFIMGPNYCFFGPLILIVLVSLSSLLLALFPPLS